MLGCGGAGRINAGRGHRPRGQLRAAGTRSCLLVPPQNPEAAPARLGSSRPGRCRGLWARSLLQVSRLGAESPLFSGIGKVEPTPRPGRMWPGWLPAPSQRWLLFSDASRAPNPQPQRLRGLGREPWPDAGRPKPAEPTPRTLNHAGLGRVAGARPVTLRPPALAVAGRTRRLPGGAGPLLCRGRRATRWHFPRAAVRRAPVLPVPWASSHVALTAGDSHGAWKHVRRMGKCGNAERSCRLA